MGTILFVPDGCNMSVNPYLLRLGKGDLCVFVVPSILIDRIHGLLSPRRLQDLTRLYVHGREYDYSGRLF